MKLVELLAKEMHEWPRFTEGGDSLEQDYDNSVIEGHGCGTVKLFMLSSRADDFPHAHVTRAQWQAERDRQKGGEWKRHRGGKCPVPVGTKVSTRHRDGEIVDVHFQTAEYGTHKAVMDCVWKHDGSKNDIMAYRVISQPQAEEPTVNVFAGKDVNIEYAFSQDGVALENLDWKPLGNAVMGDVEFDSVKADEVPMIADGDTREYKGPFPCAPEGEPVTELEFDIQFQQGVHMEANTDQIDGPIKWRDTINELDAYIEKYTRDRDALIERLASEGFALIPPVVSVVSEFSGVDMSDWRNWKAGDVVECTYSDCDNVYTEGKHYDVDHVTSQYARVSDNFGPDSFCHINDDEEAKFRLVR